jgi:hypothetical protein
MGLTPYGDGITRSAKNEEYTPVGFFDWRRHAHIPVLWMLGILFFFHTFAVQTIMAHVALYAQENERKENMVKEGR